MNDKKLEIKTEINYKGSVYDDISQLSGGEFDRCVLASVCGVNTMLGSNILILDESLASLDSDTNTDIINFLKKCKVFAGLGTKSLHLPDFVNPGKVADVFEISFSFDSQAVFQSVS